MLLKFVPHFAHHINVLAEAQRTYFLFLFINACAPDHSNHRDISGHTSASWKPAVTPAEDKIIVYVGSFNMLCVSTNSDG